MDEATLKTLDIVGEVLKRKFDAYDAKMESLFEIASRLHADLKAAQKDVVELTAQNVALEKNLLAAIPNYDLSQFAKNESIIEIYGDLAQMQNRIEAKSVAHDYYVEGEVVRVGEFRRFGIGGIFEAVRDTAKSAFDAPQDWLMISDGITVAENEAGIEFSNLAKTWKSEIRHGEKGDEGQRGKTGQMGLRGNDGVGIEAIECSAHAMAVTSTTGKITVFDFVEPLENAIREIVPLIRSIAEGKE